jgi:HEAT repeat protein
MKHESGGVVRAVGLTMTLLLMAGCASVTDNVKLGRDRTYWRGEKEVTPGPFLCVQPAATGVTVVCDRWPDGSDLRQFGLDAIRLSGAKTEQEQALAVWRWVRRWTMYTDGNPPTEIFQRAKGGLVDDPIKLLNVNGAHWCDGLSRIVEAVWRALGHRAEKLYRGGHTMVDCHWKDTDGVARWHAFDVSEGGYRLDHAREFVLGPDRMSTDSYPMLVTWIHCQHLAMPTHRAELSLRRGEKLERIWGNWGKPYQDNAGRREQTSPAWEFGPYRPAFGNGRWTYTPDLTNAEWTKGLAQRPGGMKHCQLAPLQAGEPATAVWHFRTPFIVSDAKVKLRFRRKSAADIVRLHLSVDNGRTWKPLWESPKDAVGERTRTVQVGKAFKVTAKAPKDFNSPFGRYAYRLKLELVAKRRPEDCTVEDVTFTTDVQQNFFSLPQLHPGQNKITVKGDVADGSALKVTYVWDDLVGKERRNVTVVEHAPYTYEIIASGKQWTDVVCKSFTVEAVAATGAGNRTEVKEKPGRIYKLPPMRPVVETRARWQRPDHKKLRPLSALLKDLKSSSAKVQRAALTELIDLRDPRAFDALKDAAYKLGAGGVKRAALTALYVTDRKRAKPILLHILQDEAHSAWKHDPKNPKVGSGHWAFGAVLIGQMAEEAGWTDFVPHLAAVLEKPHGYERATWGLLRVLGRIGDERCAKAVKPLLSVRSLDTVALAALAAGRTGDRSMIPRLRELLGNRFVIVRTNAALSLGRLGDKTSAPRIREMLDDRSDENTRAAAAEALGLMRDKGSVRALKGALANEPFAWVREKMQTALRQIKAQR